MAFCSLRSLPTLRPIISASPSSSSSFRAGRLAPASSGVGRGCSPPVPSLGGTGVGRAGARGRAGVLLPAGEALKGAGVRGFGVVDSVQDKIINRNAAKQGGKEVNRGREKIRESGMKHVRGTRDQHLHSSERKAYSVFVRIVFVLSCMSRPESG